MTSERSLDLAAVFDAMATDDLELPTFDDVAQMVAVDDKDRETAADSELESLSPGKSIEDRQDPQREAAISQIVAIYGDRAVAIASLDAIASYAPNNLQHALNWISDHPREVQQAKAATSQPKSTVVPMETEGPKSTAGSTKSSAANTSRAAPLSNTGGGGGGGGDNEDGIQEKCMECLHGTKVCCAACLYKTQTCCVGCLETTADGYDGLSDTERRICWGVCGCICCIGLILTAILIPVSMRVIEFDEYAIKYDGLTREEDSQEYGEGRYIFTPETKLFRYDALIQKLSLVLECLTADGIVMEIDVDIQYSIPQNNVYDIWDEFGKEEQIDSYFAFVAADAVRDAVGAFKAASFYQNRYGIQQKIEDAILSSTEEANTHLLLNNAVLSRYSFPETLKETIREKRAAENLITVALNQRGGNLTDAETDYVVAKVFAEQLSIQAHAEVESLLSEAAAHARAVTARLGLLRDLFVQNQMTLNFTPHEFIEYWLTAFVLQTATNPITNTGSDIGVVYPSGTGSTPPTTTAVTGVNDTMTTEIITTGAANTTHYFTTAP